MSKVVWHVARLNFLDWDTQTLSDNKRLNLLIMIKSINDQTFSLLFTVPRKIFITVIIFQNISSGQR